ncbi:MAG: hypothetical protein R3A46_15480 [Thermomicrobiales bacterium]
MRFNLPALIITIAALVASCSSGNLGGSKPTATWDEVVKTRVAQRNNQPTRTPIPTSTPFERKTPTIVATAGASPTPHPTFTPEPTPIPNPISASLAPVLLATEDLPTGWRVSREVIEVALTDTDSICGVNVQDPAVAELAGNYEASVVGPYALQSLSLYDGPENAAAVISQLRVAYGSCPSTGYEYEDGTWGFISPVAYPAVGDESFAIRVGIGVEDFTFEIDMVVFRVDEVIATVMLEDTAAQVAGTETDPALLEQIIRSAEARIINQAELIDGIDVPSQTI